MAVFTDDFDRTNESPVGAPYAQMGAYNQFQLASNRLNGLGADAAAIIDTGFEDVDFTVDFNVVSGSTLGITAGFDTGSLEHLLFFVQNGNWWVYHLIGSTVVSPIPVASGSGATGSGTVTLRVLAVGDRYQFWSNDDLLFTGDLGSVYARGDNGTFGFRTSDTANTVESVRADKVLGWVDEFERLTMGETAPNGWPYDAVGTWDIFTPFHNVTAPSSGFNVLAFDALTPDVFVQTKTAARGAAAHQGVVVRYVDIDNYVSAQLRNDEIVHLVARVGGTDFEWGTSSDLGTTSGVLIELRADGNQYTLWCNGVEEINYTDVDDNFLTEQNHGLYSANNSSSFEHLLIRTVGPVIVVPTSHIEITLGTAGPPPPPPSIGGTHLVVHSGEAFPPPPPPEVGGSHLVVHAGTVAAPFVPPGQAFDVAPALRGPVAYGPTIRLEGVEPAPLTARLFRRSAPNVEVAELGESFARRWQDQLSEAGSGSLSLANDDAAVALLGDDDMIRFELFGVAAFTFLVRESEKVALAPGEEHDQVTNLSGPGHVSILDEGVVYPARGVETQPSGEDRIFSWPAPDYDDTAWGPVAQLMLATATPPENEGWWTAANFPDPTAWWIWAPGTTVAEAPEGHGYVRYVFEIFAPISAIAYVTIDNGGDFYVDGQLLIEKMEDFTTVHTAEFDLSEGEHTLAMIGHNAAPPDLGTINPGGFICAVYQKLPNGDIGPLLFHTDSTWKGLWYPPVAPGMTPGEALRHAVQEAWARGAMLGVSLGFTDEFDSDGNPWPLVGDIATKVGADVLTFARELSETYIDFQMAPGSFRLFAWVKGQRGETRDVTLAAASPGDADTGNLAALSFRAVY